jgi:hypothetical protein
MNKLVYGIYDDEDVLLHAVQTIRSKGIKIKEVYTPFPVHGLEKAMGLRNTRLSIAAFIYGFTGLGLGLLMMWYMMISDWPINIGGKPNFSLFENLPAFIPVAFEITVLCAAHGMVLTFLFRSRLIPGRKATNPFPETTNDKFAVEFDRPSASEKDVLYELLKHTKASQIKEKEI